MCSRCGLKENTRCVNLIVRKDGYECGERVFEQDFQFCEGCEEGFFETLSEYLSNQDTEA